jgi:hypothetical protein
MHGNGDSGRQIGNLAGGMDLRRDRVQEMSTLLNQLKQVSAQAADPYRGWLLREGGGWGGVEAGEQPEK